MDETGAAGVGAGDDEGAQSHTLGDTETGSDPLGEIAGEDEFYEFPEEDAEGHTALPDKVEAWRRRSATGAILTGFALGLQQVFEPKKDEPAIIMETSGEPPKDLPVEADFEYGRPKQSVVNVRPWLLPDGGSETSATAQPGETESGTDGRSETGERDT